MSVVESTQRKYNYEIRKKGLEHFCSGFGTSRMTYYFKAEMKIHFSYLCIGFFDLLL